MTARCMIYRCTHAWSCVDGDHFRGYECLKCGDHWDADDCAHDPKHKGCECAR